MQLPAQELYIHHTVTKPTKSAFADFRTVQRVAFSRDFDDTSYSYLIHPDGTIGEGRGLFIGAHTKGLNHKVLAFAFVGNYSEMEPTPEQISASRWLKRHLQDEGALVKDCPCRGHRDNPNSPSECPGNKLYRRIPEITAHDTGDEDDEMSPELEAKLNAIEMRIASLQDDVVGKTDPTKTRLGRLSLANQRFLKDLGYKLKNGLVTSSPFDEPVAESTDAAQ